MAVTPPIFLKTDEGVYGVYMFDSVAEAASWLEPVDVGPDEQGYDSEGRLLSIGVHGAVRRTTPWWWPWGVIDQSGASVVIQPHEEVPTHQKELRSALIERFEQCGFETSPYWNTPLPQLIREYSLQFSGNQFVRKAARRDAGSDP